MDEVFAEAVIFYQNGFSKRVTRVSGQNKKRMVEEARRLEKSSEKGI